MALMHDDEVTERARMQSTKEDPKEALSDALLNVSIERDRLAHAMHVKDYSEAVAAASEAHRAALAARAALQRLRRREAAMRSQVLQSIRATDSAHAGLAEDLDRAHAQAPIPLFRTLEAFKIGLVLATDDEHAPPRELPPCDEQDRRPR